MSLYAWNPVCIYLTCCYVLQVSGMLSGCQEQPLFEILKGMHKIWIHYISLLSIIFKIMRDANTVIRMMRNSNARSNCARLLSSENSQFFTHVFRSYLLYWRTLSPLNLTCYVLWGTYPRTLAFEVLNFTHETAEKTKKNHRNEESMKEILNSYILVIKLAKHLRVFSNYCF